MNKLPVVVDAVEKKQIQPVPPILRRKASLVSPSLEAVDAAVTPVATPVPAARTFTRAEREAEAQRLTAKRKDAAALRGSTCCAPHVGSSNGPQTRAGLRRFVGPVRA